MSTYVYLRCEDHNPPLRADDESGQHLYDLPQIRADIANRAALIAAADDGMEMDDYFRRHTLRFLRQHPECRIAIWDEYDREHPLVEPVIRPAGSDQCDLAEVLAARVLNVAFQHRAELIPGIAGSEVDR